MLWCWNSSILFLHHPTSSPASFSYHSQCFIVLPSPSGLPPWATMGRRRFMRRSTTARRASMSSTVTCTAWGRIPLWRPRLRCLAVDGRSWESQWSPCDLDVMGTFWRKKMAISRCAPWGSWGVIAIFVPYFCLEQLWMPFTIKRLLRQKGKGCPKCNVTYTPTSSYCQQQLDMLFPRIWDGFPAQMISISAVRCRGPQFMEILISE